MFTLQVPALEIALRTALIYVALLLALRLAGKREVGQLTTFDLVVILLVSNAVQNAMVGPDNSLTGGLIAAGVLLGANYLVALAAWPGGGLSHHPHPRRAIHGRAAASRARRCGGGADGAA